MKYQKLSETLTEKYNDKFDLKKVIKYQKLSKP